MAKKNRIADLKDHLFMALEALNDDTKTAKELELEIKRASAMADVSAAILQVSSVQMQAAELFLKHGQNVAPMLEGLVHDKNVV